MSDRERYAEAERLLAMSENQLLELLVPEDEDVAFSEEGKAAKGRQIFNDVSNKVKNTVCTTYHQRKISINNSVDLTVLIAGSLSGAVFLGPLPILPVAALLVKMGLDLYCGEKADG